MNQTIHIREARECDVEAVLRYLDGLIQEGPPTLALPPSLPTVQEETDWMRRYILPENRLLLLAFSADQVIGVLEFVSDPALPSAGRFGMSVAADRRNRGVGRLLVTALLEWAKTNPAISRINLDVHACNLPAIALYSKMGFTETDRKANAGRVGQDTVDIVTMSQEVKTIIEQAAAHGPGTAGAAPGQ